MTDSTCRECNGATLPTDGTWCNRCRPRFISRAQTERLKASKQRNANRGAARGTLLSPDTFDRFFRTRQELKADIDASPTLLARVRKYGITKDQWISMVIRQRSACSLCKTEQHPLQLCIDHDHITGVIRGLLCGRCNTGLGMLKLDGPGYPDRIRLITAYLREHSGA